MRKLFRTLALWLAVSASFVRPAVAETLITDTGYRLEYAVRGQNSPGRISLVVMHGKNANPELILGRLAALAERIAQHGFRVYVPVMPWSNRWDGTHQDATSVVDALVGLAAKDGKQVVVGGHSMGAMFTAIYRPTSLPPAVIGKFMSGPGHFLDMIPPNTAFWHDILPSVERARSLESAGKGKEKVQFGGRNVSGATRTVERYEMTPEVYLSWHDPKRLPGIEKALREGTVPVLFTVGSLDPLIDSHASRQTFEMIPHRPRSAFFVLDGKDHNSSLPASMEKLVPWLKSLEQQ